ncbi:MAG: beta-ketoacyl-ACP synthase III [Desulfocapsaceae bacterium]|nr:beta-ketoacyl-ACP synthase III [Desulfocapsaceae bacterium]
MGTAILGTGVYLPERVVTNQDLAKVVDTSDEWIRTRTGISTRRIGGQGDETYLLAARAAVKALQMAELSANDIDLIIVATISSHMLMPSCACFVQKEIGAGRAFAFDINAACSGFVYALDLADKYILADPSKKILVIGAETLSSRTNWEDRNTCILFGDGAGAVVLGHVKGSRGVIGAKLFSDGKLWSLLHMHTAASCNSELLQSASPGVHIVMEGREVFKYAVKAMEEAVLALLEQEQIALDAISLVIPHQANIRILNKLVERLGIGAEKVIINVQKYGNTSAASIPIALDEANRASKIQAGDIILFCSFGGGFTWGATLVRW